MKRFWNYTDFFILLSIVISLLFIYRQVIFSGKILFPSNFLAQFYSPWVTEKFPGWETGIPHKPIGDDQIRIFYPSRVFSNEMFKKMTVPLWNPYIFAGSPHMADFQSAVFYPLNILYFFLPQTTAWSLLLFIQPTIATIFTYFFLRLFRLRRPAVWLGAIAFGFSGFMIVWSQENVVVGQAALWLPLVLFGIEGYLNTKKNLYYLVAIIALTSSFLAGFFQVTFYIVIFSFFYSIFRIKTLSLPLTYIIRTISIYVFSLCLSAIQLLPSLEGFMESPRSITSAWYLFKLYLLPVTHIFNAMFPDMFGNPGAYNFFGRGFYRETIFYIGLVPLIFAVYALGRAKANHIINFFVLSVILTFFLTIDSPLTKWFFQLPLPLIPTFLPSRIFILTTFSLSVLSAFGFSAWIKQGIYRDKKIIRYILLSFLVILFLIALYAIFMLFNYDRIVDFQKFNEYIIRPGSIPKKTDFVVMLRNLLLPFFMICLLFVLLQVKKTTIAILGVVILAIFGQFYFLNKYLVLGDPNFLYPKDSVFSFLQSRTDRGRFLTLGQPIHENTSTIMHTYSLEGVNPIFPKRYGQLLFAVKNNGRTTNDIPRVEARLSEIDDKKKLFDDARLLRLLSLLNAKYILYYYDPKILSTINMAFPSDIFKPIWNKDNWHAFEHRNAFPRTFLTNNAYVENDQQKILDLVFDPKVDLSTTVILEEKPTELNSPYEFINLEKPSNDSFASIISYEPQKVEIVTKSDKPQILFLSDNYYPGWNAYVDNNKTKIYRANYTFRSIYLPKGNHKVTFEYEPISFKIGSTVSLFSIILLLLIALYTFSNRYLIYHSSVER